MREIRFKLLKTSYQMLHQAVPRRLCGLGCLGIFLSRMLVLSVRERNSVCAGKQMMELLMDLDFWIGSSNI